MTIGDLIVRVGAQIDGFKSAMAEVSSSLNATATKMASVGTAMSAAITLPLVGVGIAALKTAGELEQNTVAFKTLLGSATEAQRHLEALRDFAAKTPFQFTELVTASKRMQALGFSAKEVLPTLRVVGDASAALGMGAEGIQRIITALGQMKAKGAVQAEEMRQLAEAGIPAWQILAKTLNTDVAGAMKLVEKRAVDASIAVPALLAGMNEKFGGLMAQQAKTLLGQWSDLKDQITFTLTDIGTALMPIAKSMFENVLKPALGTLKDLAAGFASLPEPLKNATLGIVGFAAVIGPAVLVGGKLITFTSDLYKVITVSLIPSMVSLANVVAGLGTTQLSMLATRFVGVGAGYTTMLAAGVLRIAGWVGVAIAVWELVDAIWGLEKAKAGLAAQEKQQQDGLLKLEISLKRQGADISELQKQYASGAITWTQYMQKLRDVSIELGKNSKYHEENAAAAKNTQLSAEQLKEAFGNLGLKNLKVDIDDAMKSFQMLAAAGALTKEQMFAAAMHIAKLRVELQELGKRKVDPVALTGAGMSDSVEINSPEMGFVGPYIKQFQTLLQQLQSLPSGRMGTNLNELFNLPQLSAVPRYLDMITEAMWAQANAAGVNARNVGYVTDAYHYFGLKTPQELEEVARISAEKWDDMRADGEAAPEAIRVAWERMFRDQIAAQLATGKITKQQYDDMLAQIGGSTTKVRQHVWSAAQDMERAMSGAFDSLYRGLADNILHWKGWAETIKSVGMNLAQDLLSTMLKVFMKPLEEQATKLAGRLGDVLGGIFGGGGGTQKPPVPTVPGGGGGAGGGVASSIGSFANVFNMVTGAVSAIAGVVSAIGTLRLEGTMNAVEHNTRYLQIQFEQYLAEHYLAKDQLFLKLDDIWNEIRNVVSAVHNVAMPAMQTAGGGNTITFYVTSNDPKAVVDEVAAYLRGQGVYV